MSMMKRGFSTAVKRLSVIGSGQMGGGIAITAIKSGVDVLMVDVSQERLDQAFALTDTLLKRDVEKGRIKPADLATIRGRLTGTTSVDKVGQYEPQVVVEAATENLNLKLSLLTQLDKVVAKDTILASNTSSISITKIAAATKRPQKVIGMHFFNPVPVMSLVELITGLQTSDETLATTSAFAAQLGKTTTRSLDRPGFIANRVLMPYINEAFLVLGEGTATREDIDATMKLGTNVPMGPLTLADFIGLDTCLSIMQVLHHGFGDSKYRPAPLLQQYVDAGLLGKKTGRGVYDYSKSGKK